MSDLPKLPQRYQNSDFFKSLSLKNIRLGDQLGFLDYFLKTLIFKALYFLKMCLIFVGSVLFINLVDLMMT